MEAWLRVGIDGTPAKRGAQEVTRSLDDIKQKAAQAGRSMDSLDDANRSTEGSFERVKKAALAGGGAFDRLRTAALGVVTAYAGFETARRLMTEMVEVTRQMEQASLKTEAVLRATGYASGQTAEGIRDMAREIALGTLASTQGVETAAQKLMTFRSVSSAVFKDTLMLAQDLAAVGFGSIESASVQLGKALENPAQGISALTEVGVSFSTQQKELIKTLQESGRVLDAQKLILEAVRQQVGGAGAAEAGGLSGAIDTLNQRWSELLETAADRAGALEKSVFLFDKLSRSFHGLQRILAPTPENRLEDLAVRYQQARRVVEELQGRAAGGMNVDAALAAAQGRLEALRGEYNIQADLLKQTIERTQAEEALARARGDAAQAAIASSMGGGGKVKLPVDPGRKPDQTAYQRELEMLGGISRELARQADLARLKARFGGEITPELQTEIRLLEIRNQLIDGGVKGAAELAESYRGEVAAAVQATNELDRIVNQHRDNARSAEEQLRKSERVAEQFGSTMASAFEDAVVAGKSLRDVVSGLTQDIARMVLRQSVTAPIAQNIGGFISKILPFANGGVMTSSGPLPLRAYSAGGVANSPQLALYGEGSKPEAYVPLPDGRTIPVTLRGGSGGGAPVVNIHAPINVNGASVTPGQGIDPRTLSAIGSQLRGTVRNAVREEIRQLSRPGNQELVA